MVKVLPPARLALVASAAVARVVSAVMAVLRVDSAPVARVTSAAIEPLKVNSDASARPVSVVICVPSAVSAASARAVSVATEVLEAVTSLKNASSCTLLGVTANCTWLSPPVIKNTSPANGVEGATPDGTLIEA